MRSRQRDLTSAPDLKHDALAGALRRHRPVYVDLKPPCNHACPAGENIQAWLDKAQAGEFEAAWRILVADNPMPSIHGRVCYHPCESPCNRQHVDDASAFTRLSASWVTWRSSRAGNCPRSKPIPVSKSWSSVADLPVSPPPGTCAVWVTRSKSARPGRWPAA